MLRLSKPGRPCGRRSSIVFLKNHMILVETHAYKMKIADEIFTEKLTEQITAFFIIFTHASPFETRVTLRPPQFKNKDEIPEQKGPRKNRVFRGYSLHNPRNGGSIPQLLPRIGLNRISVTRTRVQEAPGASSGVKCGRVCTMNRVCLEHPRAHPRSNRHCAYYCSLYFSENVISSRSFFFWIAISAGNPAGTSETSV